MPLEGSELEAWTSYLEGTLLGATAFKCARCPMLRVTRRGLTAFVSPSTNDRLIVEKALTERPNLTTG